LRRRTECDESSLIERLKEKIQHLEEEKRLQNDRHADLILEMAELKR